jgi:hypothetical protein
MWNIHHHRERDIVSESFFRTYSEFCNQDPDFPKHDSGFHKTVKPFDSKQIVNTYEEPTTLKFPIYYGAFAESALTQIVTGWQPEKHHINPTLIFLTNQPSRMDTKFGGVFAGVVALASGEENLPKISSNWGTKSIVEGFYNFS